MHIIAGSQKNRSLVAPKGNITRPTSSRLRETLFNICQGIVEDASFLDLFAGSGAMGLEALSRGGSHATFVDNSREAVRCITANLKALGFESKATVLCTDIFQAIDSLAKKGAQFDLIYVDPPYGKSDNPFGGESYSSQLLALFDRFPILKSGGFLFIEDLHRPSEGQQTYKSLKLISARRAGRAFLCEYQKGA